MKFTLITHNINKSKSWIKNLNHYYFQVGNPGLCRTIIRSPVLLRRVCTTPFWWLTTTLVFYGLSINSVSLSDTMHLNYILTSVMEMPGYFMAAFVSDRYGRKATLSSGYFFSALCNIIFVFVPGGEYFCYHVITNSEAYLFPQ